MKIIIEYESVPSVSCQTSILKDSLMKQAQAEGSLNLSTSSRELELSASSLYSVKICLQEVLPGSAPYDPPYRQLPNSELLPKSSSSHSERTVFFFIV